MPGFIQLCGYPAYGAYQQYNGQGFEAFFVIAQDTSGQPPTASYCSQLVTQYGLTMPVLYDAGGVLRVRWTPGPMIGT